MTFLFLPCHDWNEQKLKYHGRYLRQNLYANYQAALPTSPSMHNLAEGNKHESVESALRSAMRKVDKEVQNIVHWSFQGNSFDYKNTSLITCIIAITSFLFRGTRQHSLCCCHTWKYCQWYAINYLRECWWFSCNTESQWSGNRIDEGENMCYGMLSYPVAA
jgi:hypothetical protein